MLFVNFSSRFFFLLLLCSIIKTNLSNVRRIVRLRQNYRVSWWHLIWLVLFIIWPINLKRFSKQFIDLDGLRMFHSCNQWLCNGDHLLNFLIGSLIFLFHREFLFNDWIKIRCFFISSWIISINNLRLQKFKKFFGPSLFHGSDILI